MPHLLRQTVIPVCAVIVTANLYCTRLQGKMLMTVIAHVLEGNVRILVGQFVAECIPVWLLPTAWLAPVPANMNELF